MEYIHRYFQDGEALEQFLAWSLCVCVCTMQKPGQTSVVACDRDACLDYDRDACLAYDRDAGLSSLNS